MSHAVLSTLVQSELSAGGDKREGSFAESHQTLSTRCTNSPRSLTHDSLGEICEDATHSGRSFATHDSLQCAACYGGMWCAQVEAEVLRKRRGGNVHDLTPHDSLRCAACFGGMWCAHVEAEVVSKRRANGLHTA